MNNIHMTDVTIHVDETLDASARAEMETDLRAMDGVISVHNADERPHLVMVEYNPFETNSSALLDDVTSHGVHAEMIGL